MPSVISGDANVSATEFGFLDGVTSALQTQIDSKVDGSNSAWTAFTPTFTNFTAGNATVQTSYTQIGKTVVYSGRVTLGSTSSVGGTIEVSLPVTANSQFQRFIGSALANDAGSTNTVGICYARSATVLGFWSGVTTGAGWNATVPFTWGNGDSFYWTLTYEAA